MMAATRLQPRKISHMALLALLAIMFLDTALIAADNLSTAGNGGLYSASQACVDSARRAAEFSALTVEQFDGSVHDDKSGWDYTGCRIAGDSAAVEIRDDKWPHDILRMRMLENDWQEDISRDADGAGSTAFGLRRAGALCVFSASSTIHEPFDPVASKASRYRFEVNCFETGDAV